MTKPIEHVTYKLKAEEESDQCRRRARREVRAMGVVTLGVSLSAMTASDWVKTKKYQ
jgi:hypothetical protein